MNKKTTAIGSIWIVTALCILAGRFFTESGTLPPFLIALLVMNALWMTFLFLRKK